MDEVEKLARALTPGDPEHLVPVSYGEPVGRSETGGATKTARQTVKIPAWKLHEAEARLILEKSEQILIAIEAAVPTVGIDVQSAARRKKLMQSWDLAREIHGETEKMAISGMRGARELAIRLKLLITVLEELC